MGRISFAFALALVYVLIGHFSFAALKQAKLMSINISFIKNQGQVDERVSFYAKTFGGTLFVTKEGKLVYSLPKHEWKDKVKLLALEEVLLGAKIKEVKGTKESITKVNYFIGNDPKKWRKNIPTYEAITLGEVYKGISLTLKAYGKNVEKIFRIKPGADPNVIRLSIKGAKELKIDKKSGELVVITELGEVKFTKPVAYQVVDGKRKEIEAGYRLINKDSYAFVVGEYDRSKELVIDPLLASTFLGGGGDDRGFAIAINNNTGDIYVAGRTGSNPFPTTPGVAQLNYGGGNYDMFISRFSANLTQLIASTYLGTADDDMATAIALDAQGNVLVGGTGGNGFPGVVNQLTDITDGVLAQLPPDLSSVTRSRYFDDCGFSYRDYVTAIVVDAQGNIFVTGSCVAVTKLDANMNVTATTGGQGIGATDMILYNNRLYEVGYVNNSGPSTTAGVFQTTHGGGSHDGFIYVWDPNNLTDSNGNQTPIAASYFGGSGTDVITGIVVDSAGNLIIVGTTNSNNIPNPNQNGYDPTYNADYDIFVSSISPDLTQVNVTTYLGGTGADKTMDVNAVTSYGFQKTIAIDSNDNVYVLGTSSSNNYPTTNGAYQENFVANSDLVVSKLNNTLTSLNASTYIGRNDKEFNGEIRLDPAGNVVITGFSGNDISTPQGNYPTTPGAYDRSHNGNFDVVVSIFSPDLNNAPPVINSFSVSPVPVPPNQNATFSWDINDPDGDLLRCSIDVNNDGTVEQVIDPCDSNSTYQYAYNQLGNYTAMLIVDDKKGLNTNQTIQVRVNTLPAINSFSANPNPVLVNTATTFGWDINDADNDTLTCKVDVDNDGTDEYTINNCTSNSTQQHTYQTAGNKTAKLTVTDSRGDSVSKTINITVNRAPAINSFSANPSQGSVPLEVTFGWDISDADGDSLTCKVDVGNDGNNDYTINNCTNNSTQKHTFNKTGTYKVKLTIEDGKGGSASTTIDVQVTNANPVINSFKADPTSGNAPLEVTLTWDISDADGQTLVCKIDIDNDGKVDYTIQACKNKGSQKHTYQNANTYTVKLIVEDGFGGKVEKTLKVTVTQATTGGDSGGGGGGGCGNLSPTPALLWGLVLLVGMVRRVLRKS